MSPPSGGMGEERSDVQEARADRTDLMYAVKKICRSMANPTVGSWKKIKRLGRYLKGNARVAVQYPWQGEEQEMIGHSDSDWAGCR